MLDHHSIEYRLFAVVTDSASANDAQVLELGNNPSNSFERRHHVRCFNHILHLTARALLSPFTRAIPSDPATTTDDLPAILEDDEENNDELENIGDDGEEAGEDDEDDGDAVEALAEADQAALLGATVEVRSALTKVCLRIHPLSPLS